MLLKAKVLKLSTTFEVKAVWVFLKSS